MQNVPKLFWFIYPSARGKGPFARMNEVNDVRMESFGRVGDAGGFGVSRMLPRPRTTRADAD